jgi:Predicted membrane protein
MEENITVDQKDLDDNKVMGILAYIIFLIPLLAAKESPFARFHTNQGFLVFLLYLASSVIMIIPILGWIVGLVGYLFAFVCMIMGIINAIGGKMKNLPIIGKYRIIK